MDMTGERRIPVPRQKVWEALNDAAILKASIPGCETMEKLSDTELKATAAVKIGPIAARFTGKVQLSDLDPPNGYTISGEGQGGVAGFAKGGAAVRLTDEAGETLLSYDVKAQVGGKIAQLGARLIDASAKQMADAFFDRFTALLSPEPAAVVSPEDALAEQPLGIPPALMQAEPARVSLFAMLPEEPMGLPMVAWVGGVICFAIIVLIFGRYVF
ncbi:MAG TPA: carbon monoxide dehydrogenase subunit G [Acetobacteraceae bacterium]|nr:carbon monoxide dehydrogenase subunit G [Acetobacteraceae bacterium]